MRWGDRSVGADLLGTSSSQRYQKRGEISRSTNPQVRSYPESPELPSMKVMSSRPIGVEPEPSSLQTRLSSVSILAPQLSSLLRAVVWGLSPISYSRVVSSGDVSSPQTGHIISVMILSSRRSVVPRSHSQNEK